MPVIFMKLAGCYFFGIRLNGPTASASPLFQAHGNRQPNSS